MYRVRRDEAFVFQFACVDFEELFGEDRGFVVFILFFQGVNVCLQVRVFGIFEWFFGFLVNVKVIFFFVEERRGCAAVGERVGFSVGGIFWVFF